jgi:hypothetical protein
MVVHAGTVDGFVIAVTKEQKFTLNRAAGVQIAKLVFRQSNTPTNCLPTATTALPSRNFPEALQGAHHATPHNLQFLLNNYQMYM